MVSGNTYLKDCWGCRARSIFQQDRASAHYYTEVKNWLDITFEERYMGRAEPIELLPRNLDFWLWGDKDYG